MSDIDAKKDKAFQEITEILLSIETEDTNGLEKTSHILDVIEQVLARAIAGSALTNEHINDICEESFYHIKKMAKHFLKEEMNETSVVN